MRVRYKLERVTVEKYKSGSRAGQFRPLEVPEGATIIAARFFAEWAQILYVLPA